MPRSCGKVIAPGHSATRYTSYMAVGHNDSYLDPYRASLKRYGTDFPITQWASKRSQLARFQVMKEMCFLPGKRILDAGCSRGDFAAFLLEHNVAFASYTGVDALPEAIIYARSRNLPRCTFHEGDFLVDPALLSLNNPQVITMSGTLNTMTDEQVYATLEAAWQATSQILIFNFLSDRADRQAPPQGHPVRRFNTLALLDWAFRHTAIVALRQDYFRTGHDATIMMRKKTG